MNDSYYGNSNHYREEKLPPKRDRDDNMVIEKQRGYPIIPQMNHDKRYRREFSSNRNPHDSRQMQHRGYQNNYHDDEYDERYTRSKSNHHRISDDWKCLECSIWNDRTMDICTRCGSYVSQQLHTRGTYEESFTTNNDDDYPSSEQGRGRSRSTGSNNWKNDNTSSEPSTIRSEELDEFGRVKSVGPKKIRWPPCFETHGSSFVLDTRSGMFYESISDFFYDPKSKLYYGNKQGSYYQYDPIKQSFEKYLDCNSTDTTNSVSIETSTTDTAIKKASISINLKTKELASSSDSNKISRKKTKAMSSTKQDTAHVEPTVPTSAVPKAHAVNIEKWTIRQKELNVETSKIVDTCKTEDTVIAHTSKGEPICLLCRRRFPNLEKLRYHEEVSTLHKENLAKQKDTTVTTTVSSSMTNTIDNSSTISSSSCSESHQVPSTTNAYIDRAEERRKLHQPTTVMNNLRMQNSELSAIVKHMDTVSTSTGNVQNQGNLLLDESNIGNQLLQKLGWKSGQTQLGRTAKCNNDDENNNNNDNIDTPTNSSVIDTTSNTTNGRTTSNLQKDWDRIELIAKASSSGSYYDSKRSGNNSKHGIGHSS